MNHVDVRNPLGNTKLGSLQELMFQGWNKAWEGMPGRQGLNHNPDDPGHLYDYRGQYQAGVPYQLDTGDMMLHGNSQFKKPGHARSIIEDQGNYLDTVSGQRGSFSNLTLKNMMAPK